MRLMVDRRLIAHFDGLTLLTMLAILGLGAMTVYSATYDVSTGTHTSHAWRQVSWGSIGLVGLLVAVFFDYRQIERYAFVFYAIGLCLLIAVPLFGSMGGGSRRWLAFGPVTLQPSETMKLALIIVLARLFHHKTDARGLRLRDLAVPTALTMAPVLLILAQPDLGTAGVFLFVFASMLLLAGPTPGTLGILVLASIGAVPVLMSQLKPYQLKRITTFLNPENDPLGAGYHVIQSKIAIGSGGLTGRGYLHGTQNQLNFLPEQHTDFIFSVFSEEWGFFGAIGLIGLYVLLLVRGLVVVNRAKERFGALLAFGVLANIFWQAAINLGMTTGLLPVVGITLPFFSYGGSSLVTLMVGLGLVINVNMRRHSRDRVPRL
ncbi:MAG: rod shape-determining protein RodA [Candidatus Binatia bacterium]|nr:rod shape-determining protein RodA [Candidatus Binatia bacterium]